MSNRRYRTSPHRSESSAHGATASGVRSGAAATVAPEMLSAGVGARTNRSLPSSDDQDDAEERHRIQGERLRRCPPTAMRNPANAGPTARARLNSMPFER